MNGRPVFNRSTLIIAALALVVLGIAACTIPTQYDAELGKSLSIQLDGAVQPPDVKAGIDYVVAKSGADDVNVNFRMTPDGTQVDLMLWGSQLDTDAMIADLRRDFPAFAQAEFMVESLQTTVEAPLYERIGHDVFGIDFEIVVEGQTEEEIRQSILEQMAAAGIEGDVEVQVQQEGDMETVKIMIETNEDTQ